MSQAFEPKRIRQALELLPDIAAQENLNPPPLQQIYVPLGHQRALSLDSTLVVGMRGAGKSLWTAVLQSDDHRRFVATLANLRGLDKTLVRVGFGLDDSNALFPNASSLQRLVSSGLDPADIWKSVVLVGARAATGNSSESPDWGKVARDVTKSPEKADAELAAIDKQLAGSKQVLLVLFDALDRLGVGWDEVRPLLKGALRFALSCRTRKALRLKFFLRPDMEEDSEIWRFPDSSKLRHSKVELEWRTSDLYALLLTHLANDSTTGGLFRKNVRSLVGVDWVPTSGLFPIPRSLLADEDRLRSIVERIAGPWMGLNKKRGFTYTWIPTHLADAVGRMSPRSLLLAVRHAAQETATQYPSHGFALHYEAIQRGVAQASMIRINEIKEDYPWVEPLLEAARGLSVPCEIQDLHDLWTAKELQEVRSADAKLAPRRFTTDPARKNTKLALIDDLVELAVLYRTDDGRLNMPDIFRVGFGIKRKGGVKPPK